MNIKPFGQISSLLLLGLTIGSCSGGSGTATGQGGGDIIDRSGVTVGAISGFGSIILNGVTFDTSGATLSIDDNPGLESDLAVGQVVTVRGTVNGATGVAESITTDPTVRGSISSIDVPTGSLVILATRVDTFSSTTYAQNVGAGQFSALAVGDQVEVYGYRDTSDSVRATYIERTSDFELEVMGLISNLDSNNRSFRIGSQGVDFSAATLVGWGGQALANGDLVEVEGSLLDTSGRLVADRVELESDQQFSASDEGTELELEGVVTRFVSSVDFDLGTVAITTNASTEYSGGSAGDLTNNVFLEVEGRVNAAGVLLAEEIEFRRDSNLRFEALIDSVTGSTVTLLGLDFAVTSTTQWIDSSAAMNRTFALADLRVNDFVAINVVGSNGQFSLNWLERQDPGGSSIIEGAVTSFSQPDLVIQTVSIASDAATEYQIGESAVGVEEFFDELELDEQVRVVIGSNQAGVLQAAKMLLDL